MTQSEPSAVEQDVAADAGRILLPHGRSLAWERDGEHLALRAPPVGWRTRLTGGLIGGGSVFVVLLGILAVVAASDRAAESTSTQTIGMLVTAGIFVAVGLVASAIGAHLALVRSEFLLAEGELHIHRSGGLRPARLQRLPLSELRGISVSTCFGMSDSRNRIRGPYNLLTEAAGARRGRSGTRVRRYRPLLGYPAAALEHVVALLQRGIPARAA